MLLAGLFVVVGCGGASKDTAPGGTSSSMPYTTPTTPSTSTTPTASDTDGEVFDCAEVPPGPPSLTVLEAVAGRGLAFDDDGDLIGVSEPHLFRSAYGAAGEVWVPGLGELDQIDRLDDGDFALANYGDGSLMRVGANGATSVITTDVFAYGVRTGPDGLVYTANGNVIHRIDPVAGTRDVWLDPDFRPRVVDFSPDLDRLYVGTQESSGQVWVVPLDGDLMPAGEPTLLAEGVGGWHDGLGVDACGLIYLTDYDTLTLYTIDPNTGAVEPFLVATAADRMYGHGLVWGSGVGGWRTDALYLPQPMNGDRVAEAVIGVPYRTYPGEVLNPY